MGTGGTHRVLRVNRAAVVASETGGEGTIVESDSAPRPLGHEGSASTRHVRRVGAVGGTVEDVDLQE